MPTAELLQEIKALEDRVRKNEVTAEVFFGALHSRPLMSAEAKQTPFFFIFSDPDKEVLTALSRLMQIVREKGVNSEYLYIVYCTGLLSSGVSLGVFDSEFFASIKA